MNSKVVIGGKLRYPNEVSRIQARRSTWKKSQARGRLSKQKDKAKESLPFTDLKYQNDIYTKVKDLHFYHQGTLRFNKFVSIEYATVASEYYKNKISNCVDNLIYTFQRGADNNIHVHFAYQFTKQFLALYQNKEQITTYLHSIWNNDKFKNGSVWVNKFDDNKHKKNYLSYIFREVLPLSKWHYKQKEVDLYFIRSFKDLSTNNNYITGINDLIIEAKIRPLRNYLGMVDRQSKSLKKNGMGVKTMPKSNVAYVNITNINMLDKVSQIREIAKKHKHRLLPLLLASVWLLLT